MEKVIRSGQSSFIRAKKDLEFMIGNNKEYEITIIIDSMVYNQEANNTMLGLY